MAKKLKEVKAPFTELKVGGHYAYTRSEWPAPQVGKPYEKTVFEAEAVSIPVISPKTGQIEHKIFVRLDGGEKHYDLKELPANAIFTEV